MAKVTLHFTEARKDCTYVEVHENSIVTFESGFVVVRDCIDHERLVAHNAGELRKVVQTEDDR